MDNFETHTLVIKSPRNMVKHTGVPVRLWPAATALSSNVSCRDYNPGFI